MLAKLCWKIDKEIRNWVKYTNQLIEQEVNMTVSSSGTKGLASLGRILWAYEPNTDRLADPVSVGVAIQNSTAMGMARSGCHTRCLQMLQRWSRWSSCTVVLLAFGPDVTSFILEFEEGRATPKRSEVKQLTIK